ncbi:hypothetical protein [Streptomyces indicus]|uniref:Uncharacterized protein n=1 Tax=Streptomyces indicus TaxID=417292 RepID=A0A1G9IQU6_9ACTN|nr:hypothetical protein [Streptomyces indicus]SDL27550.1 hypothetical protein SAMN05421806_12514 [Streptomyces indicus]
MPTTDKYGQGINIASLTDAPNAERLAQDLADGFASRGVLRFASASARAATMTGPAAPVEGMLSWLQDLNRLDLYDGSTWVSVSVGASSWTTIALASGYTHNGNDNGTFQYRLLNISGEESLQFRGAINRTSYPATPPANSIINSVALPIAVRPQTKRTVLVPCSDVSSDRISLKLDITTGGVLELFGFGSATKPPWIGFNGVIVSL